MSLKKTFHLIYTDYRRYRKIGAPTFIHVVFFTQGFWATTVYRLAHWARKEFRIPILRQLLNLYFLIALKITEIVTNIYLPPELEVGEGFYVGHFGPTLVNDRSKIGSNCNLGHVVSLGYKQRGRYQGCPILGDRVYVGPHTVIIGAITIGDDAAIGAGSVVVDPVPPRAVVAGNPAKIVSYMGSFEMVRYDGMETDLARLASMKLARRNVEDEGMA